MHCYAVGQSPVGPSPRHYSGCRIWGHRRSIALSHDAPENNALSHTVTHEAADAPSCGCFWGCRPAAMPSSGHLWGRRRTVVRVAAATLSRMGPLLRHFTWDHCRLVARAAGNALQLHYLPAVLPANVASGLTGLLSRARQPPRSGEERHQTRYRSCLHARSFHHHRAVAPSPAG